MTFIGAISVCIYGQIWPCFVKFYFGCISIPRTIPVAESQTLVKVSSRYNRGEQTWPSDFQAFFEALRLLTPIQIMFYLVPIGLRILKWGKTSL